MVLQTNAVLASTLASVVLHQSAVAGSPFARLLSLSLNAAPVLGDTPAFNKDDFKPRNTDALGVGVLSDPVGSFRGGCPMARYRWATFTARAGHNCAWDFKGRRTTVATTASSIGTVPAHQPRSVDPPHPAPRVSRAWWHPSLECEIPGGNGQ